MTKSKFIRLGGWSLMLGAVSFFLFIIGAFIDSIPYGPLWRIRPFYITVSELGNWITPILLGVGMLGLRAHYEKETGDIGKNILLIGAISGPIITLLGGLGAEIQIVDWAWILLYTGAATPLACLTIWGILFLRVRPLPRWNGLPIIAGFWFPIFIPLALFAEASGVSGGLILNAATVTIFLQCVALFILGHMLHADVAEETPVIA